MANMKKIITPDNEKLTLPESAMAVIPKITDVKPMGCTVLVEMLSPNELLGTKLYVNEKSAVGSAPQAYVLALGSMLKEDCGLKVGDRVLLQGIYVPVPEFGKSSRAKGVVELHGIKAILVE